MPHADAAITREPGSAPARTRGTRVALVLVVGLFFLWAIANNLNDILIKQFQNAFTLSNLQAGLVQTAFYFGYFVLALPAGMCMRRFGFKSAIVLGLVLYGLGALLFYPAAGLHAYGIFLAGLFVIGAGLSFLETSANPLVTVLGSPDGGTRRLNFAQSFNALGSIVAVLAGRTFIFDGIEHSPEQLAAMTPVARHAYAASQLATVRLPYVIIACVVIAYAVLVYFARLPAAGEAVHDHAHPPARAADRPRRHTIRHLLRDRHYVSAVIAQFCYVGAQTCVWSFLIRYTQATMPGTPERRAADFLLASLVLFALGRFTSTALMKRFAPRRLLAVYAVINVALCAVAVTQPGLTGALALVATSFFMSLMYPTIFALGVEGFDDSERKLGASFLVMAIVGGALLTALIGGVSDVAGMAVGMAVPLGCFVVVFLFALQRSRLAAEG